MYTPLLVIISLVATCSALTNTEYENLKATCDEQLLRNRGGNLPLLVRLAFHDCVGGCDGCIDLGNADNRGLEGIYGDIQTAYNDHVNPSLGVTFADFIALCGITAVERSGYCRQSVFTFRYGRTDRSGSCVGANNGRFPSALDGYTDTIAFLRNEFTLTEREAIVLLGAHSLGAARSENSGFRGPWTNCERLDNEYYRVLLNAEQDHWIQIKVPGGHQWAPRRTFSQRMLLEALMNLMTESTRKKRQNSPPKKLMMLNSDMCLLKNIDLEPETNGVSSCTDDVATCGNSPGRPIVEELAADNNAFTRDFIGAFTKMIEKTSGTLQGVSSDTATPKKKKKKNPPKKKALDEILKNLLDQLEE